LLSNSLTLIVVGRRGSSNPTFPGFQAAYWHTDRQKTVSPAIPQYKIPIPLIVTDVSLISSEIRAIRNLQYSRGSSWDSSRALWSSCRTWNQFWNLQQIADDSWGDCLWCPHLNLLDNPISVLLMTQGPQYACTSFATFVCTLCSGVQ
jgi:hypothetical protein